MRTLYALLQSNLRVKSAREAETQRCIMQNEKQLTVVAIKALMERADDCVALAKSHHLQAEKQHEGASRQLVNASAQEDIAAVQHRNADRLESKAETLEALARLLKADAVKISGII
jgi:hypothetical protein